MTKYGLLESNFQSYTGSYEDIGPCMEIFFELQISNMLNEIQNDQIIYNTELQNCRREHYKKLY